MIDDAQPAVSYYANWIGRIRTAGQLATNEPMRGLSTVIPGIQPSFAVGDAIPLLGHWLYFHEFAPLSSLGEDGHPRRGGFLPPVLLPRRMWAGSELVFHKPLRLGEHITQQSRIEIVKPKSGRSGELVFVGISHQIEDAMGLVLTERQTLVYRDVVRPEAPPTSHGDPACKADWEHEVQPDPVMLFRYSALTFNSHRIHFDRPYVTDVEGYPGLVVHGPLIATLMLHACLSRQPDKQVVRFAFRALGPIFDTQAFVVGGRFNADGSATLFARDASGRLCTHGAVDFL